MQAKLFAWTNCSVAEFMLKLPFPPPFAVVRAGISQLKVPLIGSCFLFSTLLSPAESRSVRQMGRSRRAGGVLFGLANR